MKICEMNSRGENVNGGTSRCMPIRESVFALMLLAAGATVSPVTSYAVVSIPVPNGDFSEGSNVDFEVAPAIGLLGDYDEMFGTGPWSVAASGIDLALVSLAAPTADIDLNNVTIGGLLSVNVGGDFSNSASVYQNDIGSTYNDGWTYTLTAEVTTGGLIDLDLLNAGGVGIGLRANGTTQFKDDSGILLSFSALGSNSGKLTYTFTADNSNDGQAIGVDLYVGHGGGLAGVGVLGGVSFDNVTLSAVPEPSLSALFAGLAGCVYVACGRRARGRRAN